MPLDLASIQRFCRFVPEDLERQNSTSGGDAAEDVAASEMDPAGLDALLEYLHRCRGFDFTGYKRPTLARRLQRRMQTIDVSSYAAYVDYLEVRPNEFQQLFNTVLINVTAFFRDSGAWESIKSLLEARLVTTPAEDRPLRFWCAGCASGEEAFTLAMVVAEAVGLPAFSDRVKIYATDIDEEALAEARQATYTERAMEGVPPDLREKYFTRLGANYVINKDLRRAVIFGRHDLVQDAPISRIDLITCRNTLMYFNAETQTRILNRLHFSLNDEGILFLGKAEMLLTHANLFLPLDLKLRIFRRARSRTRDIGRLHEPRETEASPSAPEDRARFHRAAFERSPAAQIVIDEAGRVALINNRAAHLFSLGPADVSRPFHELEISYRPAELRSCLDRVRKDRRAIHLREVERALPSGEITYLDIEVVPLLADTGGVSGTQLSFTDVTDAHRLQTELRKTNLALETAHQELQSTSEELETTNEELQSTVEELETTNEELQSTNEELETMNEELQATNEELQAMNEELRDRSEQVAELSRFHGSILGSLRAGIAVLDHDLLVRTWNARMEQLWGVRADEVEGKPFVTLDIGLPIEQLTGPLRASLAKDEELERTLDCMNRRGRAVRCRVTITPLKSEEGPAGVTVVIEEITP